ncbi:MAG: CpsD/CapB family tyrosine-protein kinase [Gammaproteobacteria bacterium]
MERIKQALEKARQERVRRQGGGSSATQATASGASGDITNTQTRYINLDDAVLRENRIITGLEPSDFTEAYNILRTQVLQRLKENNWNVLAVTSPGSGEGKTLTAINLAVSIAREVDYSVLLVDANLRHPWMLEHFGLSQHKGLSDYLIDNVPLSELLIQSERIKHLALLPAGQALTNSAEMLNSPRMAELVKEMKSRYHSRIIIFDLPPVLTSADALAFSPYVDAALLVIEEGQTQKQDVERAVELLGNTNIVGTVLNKAEPKAS